MLNYLLLLLPDVNRCVLLTLLDLLYRVVQHWASNRMSLQNVALIMAPNLFGEPKATSGRVLQQFASDMLDNTLGRANCLTACADEQRAAVTPSCGQMAAARSMSNPLSPPPTDAHPLSVYGGKSALSEANHSQPFPLPHVHPHTHSHLQHTAAHGPLSNQDSCSGAASCMLCLRGASPNASAQTQMRTAVSAAAAALAALGAGEQLGPLPGQVAGAPAADAAQTDGQVAPKTRDTITVAKSEATLMKLLIYYHKILIIVCFHL